MVLSLQAVLPEQDNFHSGLSDEISCGFCTIIAEQVKALVDEGFNKEEIREAVHEV